MQERRSLLITAGGTREPIDEVRYIGNTSTGALGCALAGAALERGYLVVLLSGEGALVPPPHERLTRETFSSAADLSSRLQRWVERRNFDAIVHAAAVADFTPESVPGKIPSDRAELELRLQPVPKIVDRLKDWSPSSRLVKFKLEVGRSDAELERIAAASRLKSRADLIVVNDLRRMTAGHHPALILDGRECVAVDGKAAIARAVLDKLEAMV